MHVACGRKRPADVSEYCWKQCDAKAGSGDVLAGVITGLLAQHMKVYEGTVLGVYLHACGGDAARERRGAYSVLAEDLTEGIAACIKKTEKGR